MQDLLERAEQALELARRAGAAAAEAYVIDAPADAVSFERAGAGSGGVRLRTAVTVPHRGLGLTAQWGGLVGFASTTDLSAAGLEDVVRACRHAALPEEPGLALTPPSGVRPSPTPSDLVDRRVVEMSLADLVEVAREVAEEVWEAGGLAVGVVSFARCRRVAVANSLGLARSSLDTLVSAGAYAASPGGGLASWSRASRSLEGLRRLSVGRRAAGMALSSEGARDVVPGRQTVVLGPGAVLSLLAGSLGPALGADRVGEGSSPFSGRDGRPRLGEEVAASLLSVTDDATRPVGTGSYEFDAEGTPGGVTPLIRDGILVAVLHNNRTAAAARPAGEASSGNASRDRSDRMTTFVEPSGHFGYRSGVSPSTLVVQAPGRTYAGPGEAGVDRGLLVADVMGAFVIDPAVGDFSVTTTNAWALERGSPAYPVRRAMLTGNIYEMLKMVSALAGEPEDVAGPFSVLTPAWVVSELTVV